ncbi:hypothetical protein CF160_03685 [Enterococcus pseudoavium]|nr:hypothetical protein CF160_03685 [Enterococcus pseudoavium]
MYLWDINLIQYAMMKRKVTEQELKSSHIAVVEHFKVMKKEAQLLVNEVNNSNFENTFIQLGILDIKCQVILNYIEDPYSSYYNDDAFLNHLTEEALKILKDKYIDDEQENNFILVIKESLSQELLKKNNE